MLLIHQSIALGPHFWNGYYWQKWSFRIIKILGKGKLLRSRWKLMIASLLRRIQFPERYIVHIWFDSVVPRSISFCICSSCISFTTTGTTKFTATEGIFETLDLHERQQISSSTVLAAIADLQLIMNLSYENGSILRQIWEWKIVNNPITA